MTGKDAAIDALDRITEHLAWLHKLDHLDMSNDIYKSQLEIILNLTKSAIAHLEIDN